MATYEELCERAKETNQQVVDGWIRGSSFGLVPFSRDKAFADIGNELIVSVGGCHYTRYFIPDRQPRFVVLEWDDSGNETVL